MNLTFFAGSLLFIAFSKTAKARIDPSLQQAHTSPNATARGDIAHQVAAHDSAMNDHADDLKAGIPVADGANCSNFFDMVRATHLVRDAL